MPNAEKMERTRKLQSRYECKIRITKISQVGWGKNSTPFVHLFIVCVCTCYFFYYYSESFSRFVWTIFFCCCCCYSYCVGFIFLLSSLSSSILRPLLPSGDSFKSRYNNFLFFCVLPFLSSFLFHSLLSPPSCIIYFNIVIYFIASKLLWCILLIYTQFP